MWDKQDIYGFGTTKSAMTFYNVLENIKIQFAFDMKSNLYHQTQNRVY